MNQKNRDGETPLVTAIKTGSSIKVIKRLLQEESVDVNCPNNLGDAPMHLAALHGNLHAIECLLERGDIKADQPGWTGMQHLIFNNFHILKIINDSLLFFGLAHTHSKVF